MVLALSEREVGEAVRQYAVARDRLSDADVGGSVVLVSFNVGGRTLTELPIAAVAFIPSGPIRPPETT